MDIISRIPFVTGDTKIVTSDGKTITIDQVNKNTCLLTNDGNSYVDRVIKIEYDGPLCDFHCSFVTAGTPFITKHGYTDFVGNLNKTTKNYKGTLYNLILRNRELITLPKINDSGPVYVGTCGMKTTHPLFKQSVFQGNIVYNEILKHCKSFEVVLHSNYFTSDLEFIPGSLSGFSLFSFVKKFLHPHYPHHQQDAQNKVGNEDREDMKDMKDKKDKSSDHLDLLEKGTYWQTYIK